MPAIGDRQLSDAELREVLEALEALDHNSRYRRYESFEPYEKQKLFFDYGKTHMERLLSAGNQNGKSEAGAFECAMHLTGLYPAWWGGRRWDRAVRAWADGETSTLVRDVQQKKLCGQPGVEEAFGTGMIPKEAFHDRPSLARGVTDAYDTIQVKHYRSDGTPDGISTLTFKSYEQGRTKHQGEPIDFDWCDEEPPQDVYSEILTRTTATGGMTYITFTPLKGMTEVARRFYEQESPDRVKVTMTIYDAKHISPEQRAKMIAAWPAHEREARSKGIPMLGSGRIFPYPHEAITEYPITHIPAYWAKLWAIDFGIAHPFAAVLLLWDKDNDVIHVHHSYRASDALPMMHALQMKQIGRAVPVAWPQDGTAREKGTGEALAAQYRKTGLLMLPTHATWPDGSLSTEAAIVEMQQRIETGRFKVAMQLADFLEEFDQYHRKDGQIVKLHDDILSATQKGIMMKRYARAVPLGGHLVQRRRGPNEGLANDVDFDVF